MIKRAAIPPKEEFCPVCGNLTEDCVCCPECGHTCLLDRGELYCPVCGPINPETKTEEVQK